MYDSIVMIVSSIFILLYSTTYRVTSHPYSLFNAFCIVSITYQSLLIRNLDAFFPALSACVWNLDWPLNVLITRVKFSRDSAVEISVRWGSISNVEVFFFVLLVKGKHHHPHQETFFFGVLYIQYFFVKSDREPYQVLQYPPLLHITTSHFFRTTLAWLNQPFTIYDYGS